jgi:DNA-binding NtrC family response regulator
MRCLAILQTSDRQLISFLPAAVRDDGLILVVPEAPLDLYEELRRHPFDLVVTDRGLLGDDAGAAIGRIRALPDAPEVVVLIGEHEPVTRAELLAVGALAVLGRGSPAPDLRAALVALARRSVEPRRASALPIDLDLVVDLDGVTTESPRMHDFLRLVRRVANSDTSLLLQGETGSGKEFLARAIHASSRRRLGPFVPVHCAALSETLLESELFGHVEGAFTGANRARRGYFEQADGGTLFLDEIGEISPSLQVKLLRVLQERVVQPVGGEEAIEVDARVIAATNRDLLREVEAQRFRPDLFYRLSVVALQVPPLRDRVEDIPQLASGIVDQSAEALRRQVHGIDPDALAMLRAHAWPGNIRELMNVLERAVLLADGKQIMARDLPAEFASGRGGGAARDPSPTPGEPFAAARDRALAGFEQEYFHGLLSAVRGDLTAAARRAELNPRTLYEKMKRHGLRKEQFRS